MRRIASRHKATLTRMRVLQRQEQRRVEARDALRGTLPSRTMFCPICKLNYRSLKAIHQLSESHRQMKRFLTPFCRVCRIQFRSPMLFETHMCSLDHIKVIFLLKLQNSLIVHTYEGTVEFHLIFSEEKRMERKNEHWK